MSQPALITNFRDVIDPPQWRSLANDITASAVGQSFAFDQRVGQKYHPIVYELAANATLYGYNVKNDEWITLASPALAGTFAAGSTSVFHPTQGPRGTLTTGSTTTAVVLSTALPAAVGINQLANRGDGVGFSIHIIGNHAGGSGKTEVAFITGNTAGTTPTIYLDRTLSFTPASGDAYEIHAGRVFLLGATTVAAGIWKYYDIATNSYSGSLSTTNLPATITTDSGMVATSEAYNPYNLGGGQGFKIGSGTYSNTTNVTGIFANNDTLNAIPCLTATGSSSSTLTGQAAGGDATVLANQFRNFQLRIVQDTGTPTSVGQRVNITSHTAGASPVYTVGSWPTATPSSNALYVIEHNDNRIILTTTASTSIYTYSISGNAWDVSTTFAARGSAVGAGCKMELAYSCVDPNLNVNPGMIYSIRGGASGAIDVLDITAATAGTWSNAITYGNSNIVFTTGTSEAYDPLGNNGRYMYINQSGTQRNYRFDLINRVLEPWAYTPYNQNTAVAGEQTFMSFYLDPNASPAFQSGMSFWNKLRSSATEIYQVLISR